MEPGIELRLFPETVPTCRLGGTRHDIPIITFGGEFSGVEAWLNQLPDPAGWCERFAAELLGMAVEIRNRTTDIPEEFVGAAI